MQRGPEPCLDMGAKDENEDMEQYEGEVEGEGEYRGGF